ncbi:ATP-binding cassette domain-containing protein [Treponema sp.]|uniref:ATP-binding cassette domain-containing protein n=1 Tax=Treponema sp. TaxID=166 RepID=UPI0025E29A99|nr:ATP-binding cassette domain-containing protein [Treponema sp.]MCR5217711.1 ATP-binding cassette domain-containing protein [Treponema sp.]
MENLIQIKNCSVSKNSVTILNNVDFTMNSSQAWLITGPNGGGKAAFIDALSGKADFTPLAEDSLAENSFAGNVATVSLEVAASLIEEERMRDESEYMDKEDIGRTGRQYICEVLGGSSKKGAPLPPIAARLETFPQVKLCGVEKILDRGLRYMSTGEIRRTLLCRALLSGCGLLILSDPFAGLDAESRRILLEFFDTLSHRQTNSDKDSGFPKIILCMERFHEIPDNINKVIEFKDKKVSFCGDRKEYEALVMEKRAKKEEEREKTKKAFLEELETIRKESHALAPEDDSTEESLISFENVNVGWEDHHVLVNLNWEIRKGIHWLIRGPNGSGKTTILELITGDNMQVFRENIKIFGKRRGSGETIWDIKRKLGIVSYRLHVEYRMVGGTSLENVIISGFKDSIGLYEIPTDFEKATARAWLKLAGFAGRENDTFSSLSYGEQRAILIIRAAVKNPKVLILDEPCHGLDEDYRTKLLDLIETVAETGTTTLLHVTHDPSEVRPCEKHILELHPGEDPMFKIIEEK